MVSLAWIADGIERAEKAGGVTLEVYRRPGFTARGVSVRPAKAVYAEGFQIESDPEPYEDDEDRLRRLR